MALHLVPTIVLALAGQVETFPDANPPPPATVRWEDPAPGLQNDPPARAVDGLDMAQGRAALMVLNRPERSTLLMRIAGGAVLLGGMALGLLGVLGAGAVLLAFGTVVGLTLPVTGTALVVGYGVASLLVAAALLGGLFLSIAGARTVLWE